jgi:hypothetical protein
MGWLGGSGARVGNRVGTAVGELEQATTAVMSKNSAEGNNRFI